MRPVSERRSGPAHTRGASPADALGEWDIEAKSADAFLLDLLGLDDRIVYACVQQIAESRRNPPETVEDVLAHMERSGLRRTVAALQLGPGTVLRKTDDTGGCQ